MRAISRNVLSMMMKPMRGRPAPSKLLICSSNASTQDARRLPLRSGSTGSSGSSLLPFLPRMNVSCYLSRADFMTGYGQKTGVWCSGRPPFFDLTEMSRLYSVGLVNSIRDPRGLSYRFSLDFGVRVKAFPGTLVRRRYIHSISLGGLGLGLGHRRLLSDSGLRWRLLPHCHLRRLRLGSILGCGCFGTFLPLALAFR